jgi:hypothetical protein
MPSNEKLEVTVADVERHELYWQALSSRVGMVEQRVAAIEAILGTVNLTLQSIQSTLAADRQSVFYKALEKADTATGTVGTRVP